MIHEGNIADILIAKPVVKITERKGVTNSILKIIWLVSVFNSLFLGSLPFYEEHIKGEQILSDYIDPSKNINVDVMLTENEVVTIILKAKESYSDSELLKIAVVDPQNKEYSWEKNVSVSAVSGRNGAVKEAKDYFSFTPKVSGVHHIKISNANFQTDIELVSGMANLYNQPFFLITLFVSLVIMLTGLFSLRERAITKLIYSGRLSVNEIFHFSLAILISLIIVHNVVSL
ncbi:MAG TPA: hypothetical protein VN414_14170 [Methanosarcina sp.]|nr:hypothetical protein [Methanosarcina sp.]